MADSHQDLASSHCLVPIESVEKVRNYPIPRELVNNLLYLAHFLRHGELSVRQRPGYIERQSGGSDRYGTQVHRTQPDQNPISGADRLKPGGANGIGAATVRLFAEHGAFVCSGDQDEVAGQAVIQQVVSSNPAPTASPARPRACFKKTDVTSYESLLDLFQFCLDTYGRIDSAVSCAGIIELGNWFDPALTLDTVRQVGESRRRQSNACNLCDYGSSPLADTKCRKYRSPPKRPWTSTCWARCTLPA